MENFVLLKGYPVELEMVRGPDYPAIFRGATADEGKLKFSSMSLEIPIVHPSNQVALQYIKLVKDGKEKQSYFIKLKINILNIMYYMIMALIG